jgi:shikimate 5-dehydrogenase
MSITAPHKQQLPASKGVSYNTRYKSLNSDSSFSLANTDLEAFDELVLEPFLRTSAGSLAALVIGAGATASTFAKKLIEQGFTVTFVNRTDTNAKTLASNLKAQSIPFSQLFEVKQYHLIVRAAAVDKVEERFDFFPNQLVLDMQLEKESAFVRKARRQGSKVIDGYMFWARQAARQYRYWFGVEDIDQLAERLYAACS